MLRRTWGPCKASTASEPGVPTSALTLTPSRAKDPASATAEELQLALRLKMAELDNQRQLLDFQQKEQDMRRLIAEQQGQLSNTFNDYGTGLVDMAGKGRGHDSLLGVLPQHAQEPAPATTEELQLTLKLKLAELDKEKQLLYHRQKEQEMQQIIVEQRQQLSRLQQLHAFQNETLEAVRERGMPQLTEEELFMKQRLLAGALFV